MRSATTSLLLLQAHPTCCTFTSTFPFSSFFPLQFPDTLTDGPGTRFCAAYHIHACRTDTTPLTCDLWFLHARRRRIFTYPRLPSRNDEREKGSSIPFHPEHPPPEPPPLAWLCPSSRLRRLDFPSPYVRDVRLDSNLMDRRQKAR